LVELEADFWQGKGFIIDIEGNSFAVGDVEHGLTGFGEAVRTFTVDNRPGFVKAVDKGSPLKTGVPFFKIAAQSQITIAEGKKRLGLGQEAGIKTGFDNLPWIDRVNMQKRIEGFMTNHRFKTFPCSRSHMWLFHCSA